ncbi:MAG: aminopeptidase P family protein [Chloroflexi bacterium]|nr:aminopeptidase P family protein [Chloroflexota bacterium]
MPSRLDNLRSTLSEQRLDALFVSQAINRRYLSGFTGSAGYLIVTHKDAILATDFRYVQQAKTQAPDFQIIQIGGQLNSWFTKLISDLGVKSLGFEGDDVALTTYQQIVKAARKTSPKSRPRLISTEGIVERLRAVKETEEVESIKKAAAIADAAEDYASTQLKPGMTEKELAWILEKFLREEGSQNLPFPIIVASGPNSALPHAQPTDRPIQEGEPVVVDLGARVNGYCSDITRTICYGKPGDDLSRIYRIVLEAQASAMNSICVGMKGEESDQLARDIIEKTGYGNSFGHSLGHGVGLDEHEYPRLGPNSTDVMEPNMVFTVEPGIYIEGWGGVRIEDMVLLEEKGPRPLTNAKKANL